MSETVTELNQAELDALIERVKEAAEHGLALSAEDLQLLLEALLMLAQLQSRMADHDVTLHKLRKLAGIVQSSEKLRHALPQGDKKKHKKPNRKPKPSDQPAEPVIHQRCPHHHTELQKGQLCPQCERGKLYKYEPAVVLRISGQTPLISTQHVLERLRCNACGAYFTAPVTQEVFADGPLDQRYGYSARSLMGLQKYFAGAPFYRQQTIQQLLGFPVSASTIFDQCEQLANDLQPIQAYLMVLSGQAQLYLADDTTHRIINQGPVMKPDRRTGKLKQRSGVYTSVVLAVLAEGQRLVLYQTNVGHAGEWLDEILKNRPPTAPPPLIMSDALSWNRPSGRDFVKALCNAHSRRNFIDLSSRFPEPVNWVLERYALVWDHEREVHEQGLNEAERLVYHQTHSLPVMTEIRDRGQQLLDTNEVEANSALGQAWQYYLNHFEGLTAYCRVQSAPIDNNETEQALKLIILGRKNSLFFKTLAGAAIADVITSVVATAYRAGINVFDYLNALQRHADVVRQQPENWLPWTYQQTLQDVKKAA